MRTQVAAFFRVVNVLAPCHRLRAHVSDYASGDEDDDENVVALRATKTGPLIAAVPRRDSRANAN